MVITWRVVGADSVVMGGVVIGGGVVTDKVVMDRVVTGGGVVTDKEVVVGSSVVT